MAPIQMRNLTTFPIERLCFDLKLEVLEQLDARDVIELVKVNQGFQWMILSRPSTVFGHHVDQFEFRTDPHGIEAIYIRKRNMGYEVTLDFIRHFTFIKNIRSCNELRVRHDYNSPMDEDHASFMIQLEAVNSLYLGDCSPWRLDLLSHLSFKVKGYASLPSFLQEAPSKKDLLGHFIEAQLNECEIVTVHCWDDHEFEFYYNAFIKTHLKYVVISCDNESLIVPAIQRIVGHGIPSKNPAALVRLFDYMDDVKATIVAFLTEYPGMKQINRKNRQPFITLANNRLKGSRLRALTVKSRCFRRKINATRECIYMLSLYEFLAFYVKPDEIIDH